MPAILSEWHGWLPLQIKTLPRRTGLVAFVMLVPLPGPVLDGGNGLLLKLLD
jgi:hypothetical protein